VDDPQLYRTVKKNQVKNLTKPDRLLAASGLYSIHIGSDPEGFFGERRGIFSDQWESAGKRP
jgi:hypothetical protein